MKPTSRDEWQRDLAQRQRNVVFPDTTANEARFWRNLLTRKWNAAVIVGLALMFLVLAVVLASTISVQLQISGVQGTWAQRVVAAFGAQLILLAIGGGILLLGWLMGRRSAHRGRSSR